MSATESPAGDVEPIPIPSDTGSAGTQDPSPPSPAPQPPPLSRLPSVLHFGGIVAANPTAFGPEVTTRLLRGSFEQLAHDLYTTREDLKSVQAELRKSQQELGESKVQCARLKERYEGEIDARLLRTIGVAVGGALIGYGFDLTDSSPKVSILILTVGVVLLLGCAKLGDIVRAVRGFGGNPP